METEVQEAMNMNYLMKGGREMLKTNFTLNRTWPGGRQLATVK